MCNCVYFLYYQNVRFSCAVGEGGNTRLYRPLIFLFSYICHLKPAHRTEWYSNSDPCHDVRGDVLPRNNRSVVSKSLSRCPFQKHGATFSFISKNQEFPEERFWEIRSIYRWHKDFSTKALKIISLEQLYDEFDQSREVINCYAKSALAYDLM